MSDQSPALNLLLAQQLLRHSSGATTQDYPHPSREDLAERPFRETRFGLIRGSHIATHDNARYVK